MTAPADADLIGATDEEHVEFALGETRVVVTHDDDFLRLAAGGVPHAGIAYCRPQSRTIGQIVRTLDLMAECFVPEEMAGKIEFL